MKGKTGWMWCFVVTLGLAVPASANILPDGPGPFTTDANTVALWHFDNAAPLGDSSANSHTLTAMGDPTRGTGRYAEAYVFDGVGDYLTTPTTTDLANLSNGPCTFEVSVKLNTLPANSANVLFMGWSQRITILSGGAVVYFKMGGDTSSQYLEVDANLAVDTWYHLAMTSDGTTMRVFINGEEKKTAARVVLDTNGYSATIGGDWFGGADGYVDGIVDEVRFSDIDRSIPEPATMAMLMLGVPLALRRRR